jgi:hypothetical protein
MICAADDRLTGAVLYVAAALGLSVLMLIVFRFSSISILHSLKGARSIVPRRQFVLGDLFAFRAAFYAWSSDELNASQRASVLLQLFFYLSTYCCAFFLVLLLLNRCA